LQGGKEPFSLSLAGGGLGNSKQPSFDSKAFASLHYWIFAAGMVYCCMKLTAWKNF
jgi:hypothetical protein